MTNRAAVIIAFLVLPVALLGATGQPDLSIPEVGEDRVICFALYTVHQNVLKLTAQLYPLPATDEHAVRLEIQERHGWREVARAEVVEPGWTATFRVEPWDPSKTVKYRVLHGALARYEGTIQKDPVDKETITVAAFTGNSIHPSHGGDLPKMDIVENIKKNRPDLLFFSGDQVYDHTRHYAAWLKFGRDFGDVIRDTPTVCIPDDHDVGQPNLWGAGGKQSFVEAGHGGGYYRRVEYVNEVQRAQTSHLPDPYDPTPIERGITVYYTALTWGGISFAIIEDRKWKSGPSGLVPQIGPRPDHITDPNYDPKSVDVPGAQLLGERQLQFLRKWAADWDGADMKAVLSQTVFCGGAHLHGKRDNRVVADLDSNGWPQTGRNQALAEIRKGFAFMIGGDQHLGSVIHHGIDEWNDAGYSFCVPSIANLYLRWWAPLEPGKNRGPGMPDYTGEFRDGLGNKITVWAVANPDPEENGDALTTRAAGFGVVRFNKKARTITMECWPRNVDIAKRDARQYEGWPLTIAQEHNYGRKAAAWLPILEVAGRKNPVVQVVDEASGETVYTLRISDSSYRPKVFNKGLYTVRVGEDADQKEFKHVPSESLEHPTHISVKF
ncbi:MAG: metallophosphoesterase [Candidatus Hydrogenedentes bacterium]|nr:metallophosphoesterase [Candidatus Hydrogenedentota bacterium]